MDWTRHIGRWPHSEASRFVLCKPHRWHVQEIGQGPLVLLLHGAGGATQSFRHLMPLLAQQYRVVAIDLPGQGFTKSGAQTRCGLADMAQDIAHLCAHETWRPCAIIGHSAGAAIALELAAALPHPAPQVIGINAALAHFKGVAGVAFPLLAKALAFMPGVAGLFTASNGNSRSVTRLIEGTGSKLPEKDLQYYGALVSDRAHVNGTLNMMAQWNLTPLLDRLPHAELRGLLIASTGDRAVPYTTSREIAAQLAGFDYAEVADHGHLVHEEAPETVAKLITDYLAVT